MTWSILARDARGHFGMAIASRFFAVGSLCVHARHGVGALSTQALLNPLYGPAGLNRLAQGDTAAQAIASVIAGDPGREHRQIHVLPVNGSAAAHTGAQCIAWCGHIEGKDISVAGNMLAGPEVLEATAQAYLAGEGTPMAQRLLEAMDAGQAAGGDKRGKQAAATKEDDAPPAEEDSSSSSSTSFGHESIGGARPRVEPREHKVGPARICLDLFEHVARPSRSHAWHKLTCVGYGHEHCSKRRSVSADHCLRFGEVEAAAYCLAWYKLGVSTGSKSEHLALRPTAADVERAGLELQGR